MPSRVFELIDGAPGDRAMLILKDRVVTFADMRGRVAAIANGLAQQGLGRGDSIAVYLPNTPEWFEVVLACSRIGAVVISMNARLGFKEVGDLVERTTCKALVMMPTYRDGACVTALANVPLAQRASLGRIITVGESTKPVLADVPQVGIDELASLAPARYAQGQPSDPCLILATSGTTSVPKLVLHTQESIFRHAGDVARASLIGPDGTSMLLALPACGGFGYAAAVATMQAHRPIVLMDAFEPGEVVALIRQHHVTHMLGTNDMLDKMLDAAVGERPMPSLQMFGHANFVPSLDDLPGKAEARGVRIRGFYGMSELLAGFATQPADAPLSQRAEAGGRPTCAEALFRIADPVSGVALPGGETGELQVRTPNMMREYFHNPKATADAFTADGFFRTGDLAYRTPDGLFNFVSRMNDVLRIGGYLVSPVEIEEVVAADPAVQTCQVVAVSRQQGVRPVAFVLAHPGHMVEEAAILAMCRAKLAVYKVPIRVFVIDDIPMVDGPNGKKVQRVVLRQMADQLLNAEEAAA